MVSLSVLLFELALTRIFSIVLWYDYAFMAISVAFFGLGIGSLLTHILRNKIKREKLASKILQNTIIFAVSVSIFLFVIGHVIPPNIHFIYLFYLTSSIPFFFAGISMSLIFFAMPREVSKLYFIDLVGAATAALILDPLMQRFGGESVLLLAALLVLGSSLIAALVLFIPSQKKNVSNTPVIENKIKLYGIIVLAASTVVLVANTDSNILAIKPGENKGLHYQLAKPSIFEHLSTQWNSFSRIDVTRQIQHHQDSDNDNSGRSRALAAIAIDADADTPVFKWNGSSADLLWMKKYMDYLPFEISNDVNNTLVIGSGGGEDILIALAGGSKKVTAVEINPLIISAAKQFGNSAGNLYERKEVELFIDDGRRFISSSNSKYDMIVIKLVDSWAAQLAGGYALSENYLYTVEAFRQYLRHLNEDNGMLVMVRWNFELPRLMPLVVESLRQEKKEGASIEDIRQQILVAEDRPGLYFESNDRQTIYPVLLIIKNTPFTDSEINVAKERIANNNAKVIAMPGGYIQPPYDRLLLDNSYYRQQLQGSDPKTSLELKPPTDDSPFYFAREQIPSQMILLLETVLGVSGVLALLLIYYSRRNRILLITSSSSWFHIIFVAFIGLGFMFLEITFIQKFLLLLGTPIMALTVILFSILLSSGIGAYLSGRLFRKNPYKAVVVSIPLLVGIVLAYYGLLQGIIDSGIILQLPQRIALTFALISPAGLLMGFQFPSITRMASMHSMKSEHTDENITLLWGINIITSVIATVLTAISSMVIGFNGNLLIGAGLYLGALVSAIAAVKLRQKLSLAT
jgi:predicted membrane-bound spermidine synthase